MCGILNHFEEFKVALTLGTNDHLKAGGGHCIVFLDKLIYSHSVSLYTMYLPNLMQWAVG